ncbi:MAG TPA: glycosyltransferase, partial [Vicinamibacterales bacterium]|nr:glycosyltransferase [Vicinamibacterales bacterium]
MTVAVVLHFRTPVETSRAVQSLVASTRPPSSIVVVDNDAPVPGDGRLELPAGVIRIATGRNLGFPAGINAGIAEARRRGAGRLLLVNSDATLEPAALERLEAALDTTPEAGIAGPVVLFGDR